MFTAMSGYSFRNTLARLARAPLSSFVQQGDIQHNSKAKEFYVEFGNAKACLQYEEIAPSTVDLYHTEVPEALQGKGLAKLLAKAALDYVVSQDLKMKVSCTYLQRYLKDNPNPDYLKRVIS